MIDRETELLHRYLDGQLSGDEQQEFEALIESSASLREELADFAQVGDMLREHVSESIDAVSLEGFYDDLEAHLDAEDAKTKVSLFDRIKQFLSSPPGATVLVAAAICVFFIYRSQPTNPTPTPVDKSTEVLVEKEKTEGADLIKVSKPVNKDERTVIWLMDKEKDSDAGVGTDAGIEKPF